MGNFFQYPTHSQEDLKWGLILKTLGHTVIPPGSSYPPLEHPKSYQFDALKTRSVSEYQIVYITSGKGLFEAENGIKHGVMPGTVFLLFPGVTHRYYPNIETGWTEYYIGVEGAIMDNFLNIGFLSVNHPILQVGTREGLLRHYKEIFQLAKNEKKGWQQAASGAVIHLIGDLMYLINNQNTDSSTERIIENIKAHISENLTEKINWEKISKNNGVSYSKLRKLFKSYMGMTLSEYLIQVRITEAKLLLAKSNDPIKHIAVDTGFQNEYYFNRMFKKMVGVAPGMFRSQMIFKND
ncbi:helix-turn-helix transcriptional regulator [Reichenbachiella ulvae]|uniref:AraC family transcriptional regulator n=1 Tax=Reichenbachiella ulvae TaxID=2980104 RepID=A0ABT3CT16_9BACT|nr:AraC family transcriptional regulator [Reichenbachiella ulvae]MCV9386659.1 AraC family transcriptional regulator [Reichenbachiella ulvae]